MPIPSCKQRKCSATPKVPVCLVQPIHALTLSVEHATPADLLSRALFAYERAFLGSFMQLHRGHTQPGLYIIGSGTACSTSLSRATPWAFSSTSFCSS